QPAPPYGAPPPYPGQPPMPPAPEAGAPAPEPMAEADPLPEPEPEADDLPMPEPDVEPENDGELPSDDELAAMLGDDDVDDLGSASFTPDSAEDLTEMDSDDLEDPDPIESLTPEDNDEYEDYDDFDPEDIPDPDPIPGYAGVDGADQKRSFKGIIISLVIVLLLGGLFGGAVVMRETVVGFWGGSNSIFTMIGMRVPQPGDGLDLQLTNPSRDTVDGKDVFQHDIIIENTSEETQPIPIVISSLLDGNGLPVQELSVPPTQPTIEPGKSIKYKAKFLDAPATGRQFIARWGNLPDGAGQPKPAN
ncbi:MAG: hypothetical protein VW169_03120, partial [Rhodospirillaceae bacterium]